MTWEGVANYDRTPEAARPESRRDHSANFCLRTNGRGLARTVRPTQPMARIDGLGNVLRDGPHCHLVNSQARFAGRRSPSQRLTAKGTSRRLRVSRWGSFRDPAIMHRQRELKCGATWRVRACPQSPPMSLDDRTADR